MTYGRRTSRERRTRGPKDVANATTIATVLLPAERPRVDAAGHGHFAVVHRDSISDAIRVVRERAVDAVLVSVNHAQADQVQSLASLVHEFPSVPTVALVSQHSTDSSELLLRFGATGVRQVIDVTSPAGWHRLRHLVGRPVSRMAARIRGAILPVLADAPPDARLFMEAMIRLAPNTPTVRAFARRIHVRPSTLMSRFARAGLPTPKNYLAALRLLHAAQLFEDSGLSIADVAYRLEYSSPQSLSRHLRSLLGISSSEFRRRFPFPVALTRFIELMVTPYGQVWRTFHPLGDNASRHVRQAAGM